MTYSYLFTALLFVPVVAGGVYLTWLASRVPCGFARWLKLGGVMASLLGVGMIAFRVTHAIEGRGYSNEGMAWLIFDNTLSAYMILTLLCGAVYLHRVRAGGWRRHSDRVD